MNEGSPLHRFFFSELVPQAGGVGFNHHVTPRERCLDRIYQNWTLKTIQARERPQIEIVLHSAVQHSKHGQRLQLFGDDRFLWISPQDRSRKFQKGRVLDFNCCWCNNVAKAIDLHWDSSASKGCMEANAHALVLG